MRISHRHRFIFFANPKTGSSSVRQMLDPYTDVFSVKNRFAVTPENPFYPHMRPIEARDFFRRFGWDFDRYRKFTFVRNPWARLVSLYEHIRRVEPGIEPFSQWLDSIRPHGQGGGGEDGQRWRKYGTYSLKHFVEDETGRSLVDRVIRLENIDRDLLPYLRSIGIPVSLSAEILHRNRGPVVDYTGHYCEETAQRVAELYRDDIEHYGYRFGAAPAARVGSAQAVAKAISARATVELPLRTGGAPSVPLRFLVPGFSKCGTTTLCELLNQHPQLYLPTGDRKEPSFFSRKDYASGWDNYRTFFEHAPGDALLGEGSQSYGEARRGADARRRILRHYPDVKLIFIARDPMDRIESSYREYHHNAGKLDHAPFPLSRAMQRGPGSILDDTQYLERIRNYTDFVDPKQVLVIFLEELAREPASVLRRCFEFLGVDPEARLDKMAICANIGSSKFRDTQRLRYARRWRINPDTAWAFAGLDPSLHNRILEQAGLRRKFDGRSLRWSQDDRRLMVETLREDIVGFLETYGRDLSIWPRFERALRDFSDAHTVTAGQSMPLAGVELEDYGEGNRVLARAGAPGGRLAIEFCGCDNTVELAGTLFAEPGAALRIVGDNNRLVLGTGVKLGKDALVCIDGDGNHLRIRRGHERSAVLFVETTRSDIEIGRDICLDGGQALVISEHP